MSLKSILKLFGLSLPITFCLHLLYTIEATVVKISFL